MFLNSLIVASWFVLCGIVTIWMPADFSIISWQAILVAVIAVPLFAVICERLHHNVVFATLLGGIVVMFVLGLIQEETVTMEHPLKIWSMIGFAVLALSWSSFFGTFLARHMPQKRETVGSVFDAMANAHLDKEEGR